MEQQSARLRNTGFLTFFFSGICAISAGVVVSLLQEEYGFAYGMTGTLLSLMSIGNLIAGFLVGVLPGALGMKRSVLLLTIGYAVGYSLMGLTGAVAVLALAFFLVGIAKGSVMNALYRIAGGHAEAMEFLANDTTRNLGIPLKDLRLKKGILIAVLVHQNRIIIPDGSSILSQGDTVIIVSRNHGILDINDIYDDSLLDMGAVQ